MTDQHANENDRLPAAKAQRIGSRADEPERYGYVNGWNAYREAAITALAAPEGTPSSRWSANGEPDPHGKQYDCERGALAHGDMSDDELANAVFLCDHRRSLDSMGLLIAAKDRIRWLSRKLAAAGVPTR